MGEPREVIIGDCRDDNRAKRKPRTRAALRPVATCRNCGWAWKPGTGYIIEPCPHCGKDKDVRLRKSAPRNLHGLNTWRDKHPGHSTKSTRNYRYTAVLLIGRGEILCCRCGCDFFPIIEINHKNGGGQSDLKGRSQQFYRDIAKLRRPIDDLELLCKPCNAIHAIEMIHGALPISVVWGSA